MLAHKNFALRRPYGSCRKWNWEIPAAALWLQSATKRGTAVFYRGVITFFHFNSGCRK